MLGCENWMYADNDNGPYDDAPIMPDDNAN